MGDGVNHQTIVARLRAIADDWQTCETLDMDANELNARHRALDMCADRIERLADEIEAEYFEVGGK
jgi:copper homeostasis protein CutC